MLVLFFLGILTGMADKSVSAGCAASAAAALVICRRSGNDKTYNNTDNYKQNI